MKLEKFDYKKLCREEIDCFKNECVSANCPIRGIADAAHEHYEKQVELFITKEYMFFEDVLNLVCDVMEDPGSYIHSDDLESQIRSKRSTKSVGG